MRPPGEPGPHLVAPMPPQYEKALLRGYVESCSNLTWCTNPQGCDRVLCRQGLGCGTTCSKCGWASCFNCSFPEVGAHPGLHPEPVPTPHPALPPCPLHTRRFGLVLILLCHQVELCPYSYSLQAGPASLPLPPAHQQDGCPQ